MKSDDLIRAWQDARRSPAVPAGFADRVMARVQRSDAAAPAARGAAARPLWPRMLEAAAFLAATALYGSRLIAMIAGFVAVHGGRCP